MTEAELLGQLPAGARLALSRASDAQATAAVVANETGKALAAVGIPQLTNLARPVFPVAAGYDDVQRAALAYTALRDLPTWPFACPPAAATRRRWLGLAPPGPLEARSVDVDGKPEPLWRALQLGDGERQAAILDSLPFDVALEVLGELYSGLGYRIDVSVWFPQRRLRLVRELRDEGRDWAIALADHFPVRVPNSAQLKSFVFLALVRAQVPIEPRWDALFPYAFGATMDFLLECARALPEDRRIAVLRPILRSLPQPIDVIAAFPSPELVRALFEHTEPNSDAWNIFAEELRARVPALAPTVAAIVAAAPPPIELYVARAHKPKSAAELSPLEREQLLIGVRGYWEGQGADSDGGIDEWMQGSFDGTVSLRTITDADGQPCYDAFTYAADGGIIFRAGTTEELGCLVQGGVDLKHKNPALRVALQTALGPRAKMRPATLPPTKPAARPRRGKRPRRE